MQHKNQSKLMELYLQGITDISELQTPLFLVFLLIYLLTLTGNFLIIIIICLDRHLYKPMYYFLCNLSFLDFSLASAIQPKFLSMLVTGIHSISFNGCITQLYFFMFLTAAEFFLLTAMAYDRYVAICKPLQYHLLMNYKVCTLMAATCWAAGMIEPSAHAMAIAQLPLHTSQINHFYCDYSALLKISSVDTKRIEVMTYLAGVAVGMPAFSLTIASYVSIIATIVKIHSSQGRQKAFSTCVSHLTIVFLFYSTVLITIMRPTSKYSSTHGKLVSLLYTILVPSINPFIYTLRNQDVKQSFYKASIKWHFPLSL
ncbi:hypothetical protein XELAEV_18040201mg [Xenopus laevis]|uniref:Olfactory receptor n=1 Tax=Xenopus laevis TaxID=8355 RepID=A0A974C967_XENLA|nr:hypothetical protein XELAEV_18040201mg [Xenopus laevis]